MDNVADRIKAMKERTAQLGTVVNKSPRPSEAENKVLQYERKVLLDECVEASKEGILKHSQGPWWVGTTVRFGGLLLQYSVSTCHRVSEFGGISPKEIVARTGLNRNSSNKAVEAKVALDEANAGLIAAAPDLYIACQTALKELLKIPDQSPELIKALKCCKVAINRARCCVSGPPSEDSIKLNDATFLL